MPNELVPVTGTDLVPATGTEVALRETLPAVLEDNGTEVPSKELPKHKTVDPAYMKPAEVWRMVNRLRRCRFYLSMDLFVKETRFKEDDMGWRTRQLLPVTARQAMDLMKELERRHADDWVRTHFIPSDGSRYSLNFLAIG